MSDPQRHDEFVEILTQHRSQLFGYIYSLLRNRDDAEDIYQDTALLLWSKFSEYRPGTNFIGWACMVAKYLVANHLKTKRRHRNYFSQVLQDELATLQASITPKQASKQSDALVDCINKLSESDRELVQLCWGGHRQFNAVAAELGRSPQSVYDALSRIRRMLIDCIDRTVAHEEHPRMLKDDQ